MANTAKQSNSSPAPAPAKSSSTIPLVLKTKGPDGKWQVHGYVNVRPDFSGGVATLLPNAERMERVAVFPNDKKKDEQGQAQQA